MTTQLLLDNPRATAWAERLRNSQDTSTSKREVKEGVRHRTELLLETDPDDRLSLLESPEWEFNEEHLRQVNTILATLVDASARRRIREIAEDCLKSQDAPFTIVHRWLTEEKWETLGHMVSQATVPDRLMAFCYAWLEVYETAMAIYVLECHRKMPRPDFENFEPSPEQHESDRRFASLT